MTETRERIANDENTKTVYSFDGSTDFSDSGNALTFCGQNLDICYCDAFGWLVWDEGNMRWKTDEHAVYLRAEDFTYEMRKTAINTLSDALHIQADAKTRDADQHTEETREDVEHADKLVSVARAYLTWANKSRNASRIKAILDLSKHKFAKPVERFDANPFILNTPKGVYDLRTGTLDTGFEAYKYYYQTKVTLCGPGDTGADIWADFLETITCHDKELETFLQEVVGMSLFGVVYHEGIILCLGGGRNGKSSFWNAVASVLGDYAGSVNVDVLTTTTRNTGPAKATLRGLRLVLAGELEQGRTLSTSALKQISSVDEIDCEPKYFKPFSFKPSHSLIVHSNYLPKTSARDSGTWERILVCPFNARIDANNAVPNFAEKLVKDAGPAILKWAIAGAVRFWDNGRKLVIPATVMAETADYRQSQDWLQEFLDAECDRVPSGRVQFKDLYTEYSLYCKEAGEKPRSRKDLSDAMKEAGFKHIHPKNKSTFEGLELKPF